MTNEPSPRPWRAEQPGDECRFWTIRNPDGVSVCTVWREADAALIVDAVNERDRLRAALSAPARNCDRFKTLDEAREAFQGLRGHKILADVELWDSMDEAGALVRWLFATAEGGAP